MEKDDRCDFYFPTDGKILTRNLCVLRISWDILLKNCDVTFAESKDVSNQNKARLGVIRKEISANIGDSYATILKLRA